MGQAYGGIRQSPTERTLLSELWARRTIITPGSSKITQLIFRLCWHTTALATRTLLRPSWVGLSVVATLIQQEIWLAPGPSPLSSPSTTTPARSLFTLWNRRRTGLKILVRGSFRMG